MSDDGKTVSLETHLELLKYIHLGRYLPGVIHDLNNFMGVAMAYAELVSMETGLSEDSREMLGEIVDAIKKGTDLTTALGMVVRKESHGGQLFSIAKLLRHVISLCSYSLKKAKVDLSLDLPEDLQYVHENQGGLTRAIYYLLINGLENIGDSPERTIGIIVRLNDDFLEIILKDSGPPVPEDRRDTIFDLYETTKDGPHLGLGLNAARDTARECGGDLTYNPTTGFTFLIPITDDATLEG